MKNKQIEKCCTVFVVELGNVRRNLETIFAVHSQRIDPVDKIVFHLSPLETTALCFPLRSLDISRYHREQHEAQYFPSPCSVHWDRWQWWCQWSR